MPVTLPIKPLSPTFERRSRNYGRKYGYRMRAVRAPTVTSNAVAKAKSKAMAFKLTNGRTYTSQARGLARKLVKHGCSQEFVGIVVKDICEAVGVKVNRNMSRPTMGRSIGEGGVAVKIQIVMKWRGQRDGMLGNAELNSVRGGEWTGYDYAYRVRSVWRVKEAIGLTEMKEAYGIGAR
ncbi:hypothetical protein B0H17DRAFT_1143058 [Mycena rosella]|uniref:Uncharacterized protein n=1 Tax=Mycena rosella TaxID=1033263 RepID=A0AAD7CVY7_MYCRO|nr:hypothetical protein B0H17DRAFT_1143058 [Mycena rosella]